jgi:hypothetical protein
MKRKIYRRIAYICISLGVLALILHQLRLLTENKLSYTKTAEFVETADEYDVLFFGTSHMTMSVYPMELWKDYGITSYNLGGNGHPLAISYWILMNALDYANPQLAVIDCYTLQWDAKVPHEGSYAHESIDAFPLRENKCRAVWDLYDSTAERIEYLWDFTTYHYRWSELKKDDFNPQYGLDKGADYTDVVAVPNQVTQIAPTQESVIESVSVTYLEKMIEECQKRDINVLLTYMPYPASEDDQLAAKYVKTIAAKYGVDYINFLETDVVNYAVDCYDEGSHLNSSGARKVTNYLGEYMQAEYGIPDHRGTAEYAGWDGDYANYMAFKTEKLQNKESLKNYLMLLADKSYSCRIYIKSDSGIWSDDAQYRELLENLAFGAQLNGLTEAKTRGEAYFLLVDNGTGNVSECVGEEATNSLTDQQKDGDAPDVQILVYDSTNGELVDQADFELNAVKK